MNTLFWSRINFKKSIQARFRAMKFGFLAFIFFPDARQHNQWVNNVLPFAMYSFQYTIV